MADAGPTSLPTRGLCFAFVVAVSNTRYTHYFLMISQIVVTGLGITSGNEAPGARQMALCFKNYKSAIDTLQAARGTRHAKAPINFLKSAAGSPLQ